MPSLGIACPWTDVGIIQLLLTIECVRENINYNSISLS